MVAGLKAFIKKYNIKCKHGKLVFYKAVSKEWGSLWKRDRDPTTNHGTENAYLPGTTVHTLTWDTNRLSTCAPGLHVGTIACAKKFSGTEHFDWRDTERRMIRVLVDPRDVVCVPRDCIKFLKDETAKLRCKKLYVECEVDKRGRRIKQKVEL